MNPRRSSLLMPSMAVLLATGAALILTSCRGVPTRGEIAIRDQREAVAEWYRPGDNPPTLQALTPGSSLAEFLRYAVLRNPSVEASYYEWAASIERITLARSLPDPVFTLGIDVQKSLEDDVAEMVMALMGGVMTELPGPGKLKARADLQTVESRAQFARFQLAGIDAALAARTAYFDLYLVEMRIAITERNLALVLDIEESARRRSEAGLANLQDVLQVESDVARLRNDLANLQDQRVAFTAVWKSTLGIPPTEVDPPIPANYQFTAEDDISTATLAQIIADNPRLRVMQTDIARAESAIAVAYKARVPDFTLGIEAEAPTTSGASNPRDTVWKPRVGFTVPLWRDRIAAEIAEAEAMKLGARANYTAEQLDLAREFALNGFGIRETDRNLAVLRTTLIPHQRDIVELTQRGYQGGVVSFFELIEQQRRILELELMEAEGIVERERMIGELNLALAGQAVLPLDAVTEGDAK